MTNAGAGTGTGTTVITVTTVGTVVGTVPSTSVAMVSLTVVMSVVVLTRSPVGTRIDAADATSTATTVSLFAKTVTASIHMRVRKGSQAVAVDFHQRHVTKDSDSVHDLLAQLPATAVVAGEDVDQTGHHTRRR